VREVSLNDREKMLLQEIEEWESSLFSYFPNDLEQSLEKWLESGLSNINEETREAFFSKLDSYLFHLHAFIENSQSIHELKNQSIRKARTFNENINELADVRNLSIHQVIYMADQQIAKQRLLSLFQGGLSGYGGSFTLMDLPLVIALNLRAVQSISISYGYDVHIPYEMMLSLKVYHAATLPKRLQGEAWKELFMNLPEKNEEVFFYEGSEEITNLTSLSMPLKQIAKQYLIRMVSKKQGIPLVSMAIGASLNYKFAKEVTDFTQKFYQKRLLLERSN
jgi:hypothetical protein